MKVLEQIKEGYWIKILLYIGSSIFFRVLGFVGIAYTIKVLNELNLWSLWAHISLLIFAIDICVIELFLIYFFLIKSWEDVHF